MGTGKDEDSGYPWVILAPTVLIAIVLIPECTRRGWPSGILIAIVVSTCVASYWLAMILYASVGTERRFFTGIERPVFIGISLALLVLAMAFHLAEHYRSQVANVVLGICIGINVPVYAIVAKLLWDDRLPEGCQVRVTGGPDAGQTGRVIGRATRASPGGKGRTRIRVEIDDGDRREVREYPDSHLVRM